MDIFRSDLRSFSRVGCQLAQLLVEQRETGPHEFDHEAGCLSLKLFAVLIARLIGEPLRQSGP